MRMISCGKWAPLKLNAIVALPLFAPCVTAGEHTLKSTQIKICDKTLNRVECAITHHWYVNALRRTAVVPICPPVGTNPARAVPLLLTCTFGRVNCHIG